MPHDHAVSAGWTLASRSSIPSWLGLRNS